MQDICNQDVLIYRFLPHGSRKIEDCGPLHDPNDLDNIKMICHDQESLNFKDYAFLKTINSTPVLNAILSRYSNKYKVAGSEQPVLLLHSEMQSQDVTWFEQNGSIGVYWWSHAVIARDWFRYAEVDATLTKSNLVQKEFLIYNRAWSGLREYRIKFTELVLEHNLQDHCQLTFNPNDGKHWLEHKFNNPAFAPTRKDLDQYFCPTTAVASASADYNSSDYAQTAIEVVLETVFDDTKWHLTEKSLRPIACGQPFILVSTPGILQYLRRYGFQTFGEYIDESYDNIQDPVKRLEAIVKLMQSLANLSDSEKHQLYANLATVCEHNKRRFFSKEFFDQVVNEFSTNVNQSLTIAKSQSGPGEVTTYSLTRSDKCL